MHELLRKFWKENDKPYLLQPITLWLGAEEHEVKGFIFENHIGIGNVKEIAGEGLFVYAMRHGDDWCEPSSIEKNEVVVNFYAYLVTDEPLEILKDADWTEDIAEYSMDWGEETYWE